MSSEITQPLSELAEINPRVDMNGLRGDTLVSFIPMSDVSDSGQWIGRQVRRLDEVRVGYTPFVEDDVLFAKITPCMENGKGTHATGLKNGLGFGSTEFHVLRVREDNDPRFLFHWLQARVTRTKAIAYMGGSAGQQRVQADFFSHFRIPRIDPREQTRIASVLDTVDEAVAKTEAVIAKLKQVRAGLLHDLLTRGLDENGQLRDPIAHPEQFKDSPLGRMPREWDVVAAHGTCVLITKGTTPSPAAFASNERAVRYLRVDNLTFSGLLDLSLPPLFIDYRTHSTVLRRSVVLEGDVLTNIVGPPLGKVAIVPPSEHAWNVNQAIAIFRVSDQIIPNFLAMWLLSRGAQDWLWRRAKQTSGQVNLTLQMCSELPIPVPKRNEQSCIMEVLWNVDTQISIEHKSLQKARHFKQGLMTDLLTGRVRVPEGIAVTG